MPHPNAELITRAYDAFGRGDIVSVLGILSDDIRWRVPGQSPLSGDYNGHGEVLNFFTKSAGLSGGTLRIDVHDILADDSKVFVLCTVSATRAGKSVGFLEVHVWMMANGAQSSFASSKETRWRRTSFGLVRKRERDGRCQGKKPLS